MTHLLVRPLLVLIFLLGQLNSPDSTALLNDHFADAESISVLPFTASLDISSATLESDEPPTCAPADHTVWYAFTALESAVLIMDTLGNPSTSIDVYESFEPGLTGLVYIQCVTLGGAATFEVEAGKTYFIQVGAVIGEASTVQFSLSELTAISGRITDSVTGAPLPGDAWPFAWVTLQRVCGEGCLEPIVSAYTDGEGRFQLSTLPALQPGTYFIEVTANLYPSEQFGPFEFSGENLDVGDLALDPLPKIRSIRGRLLDRTTGKPIPSDFFPAIYLYRCTEGSCAELVNVQSPDRNGQFHFDTDYYGNQLPVGTYQIEAYGDQYESPETQLIDVGEGESRSVGTVRLRSFPVRFTEVRLCDSIPAEGGDCLYSMRVWNGLDAKFEGHGWSVASTSLPDSTVGFTNFQVKESQVLSLAREESQVIRFRLRVPAGGAASDTGVCIRVFIGRGSNSFFNTVGFQDLFCVFEGSDGFAITPSASTKAASMIPQRPHKDMGVEVEPNNSCQEAQDVTTAAFPFSVDGNLDSSQSADVDFYRFRGTAGERVRIDHEGQSNGIGTLFDPLLGVFDSACNLIATNDDGAGLNSRLILTIPADGLFTVAATEYPDIDFVGGGNGTYRLTVSPFQGTGSIRGRITDSFTGAPLPGDAPPYAFVGLLQCDALGCVLVNTQPASSDGSFYFDHDSSGIPLGTGSYRVAAIAEQYQAMETEQFDLGEGENRDLGDLALVPWRVQVSDGQACVIPSEGGVCEYSVKVTNPFPTHFSGKAWSIVSGDTLGSFVDFTVFQTSTPLALRLAPGESQTLHFRFRVRGAVPDGAYICSEVYIGENPDSYFSTVGGALVFCLLKGPDSLSLMSPEDAQAKLWQIQLQKLRPNEPLAKKIK